MKLQQMGHVIFVVALATAACDRANRADSREGMVGNSADQANDSAEAKPISLTGCLQAGDGRSFVLTGINEPSRPSVGTSGSPEAVERERMRQAANAYRIEAKGDMELDRMIGKQVRVEGTLGERADLPQPGGGHAADGQMKNDAAANDSRRGDRGIFGSDDSKIDEKDLAQIDATSVSVVAEQCGSEATGTGGSGQSQRQ